LPGITWRYRSYIVIPEIRKVRMMDSKQFRARYVAISTLRPSWGRSTVGAAVSSEQPSASTN